LKRKNYTIIADSGSTKADWRILQSGKVVGKVQTQGFNPNYHDKPFIINSLSKQKNQFPSFSNEDFIYFYGSGCSDEKRNSIIVEALSEFFQIKNIIVNHDLLGAARATCSNQSGIIVILGTGANTFVYDGEKQIDAVANLGYILGDEGGGDVLGKKLLRAYFYRTLPSTLTQKMAVLIPGGRSELLDNLYGKTANPANYMASFAKFYGENREHPFIQSLLAETFTELIEHHLLKYKKHLHLSVNFVGSVAFHFQEEIGQVLEKYNLKMGKVVQQPIEGLVEFHLN